MLRDAVRAACCHCDMRVTGCCLDTLLVMSIHILCFCKHLKHPYGALP
jgi:hypothetical protein